MKATQSAQLLKKLVPLFLLLLAGFMGARELGGVTPATSIAAADNTALHQAFRLQRSGVQLSGAGEVFRILADDNKGSRHQKFLLRLDDKLTLLVAHNIDLAPRIEALAVGDYVAFNGVYEWNDKGGVMHWTHHDPRGQHEAGWLEHAGRRYQ